MRQNSLLKGWVMFCGLDHILFTQTFCLLQRLWVQIPVHALVFSLLVCYFCFQHVLRNEIVIKSPRILNLIYCGASRVCSRVAVPASFYNLTRNWQASDFSTFLLILMLYLDCYFSDSHPISNNFDLHFCNDYAETSVCKFLLFFVMCPHCFVYFYFWK